MPSAKKPNLQTMSAYRLLWEEERSVFRQNQYLMQIEKGRASLSKMAAYFLQSARRGPKTSSSNLVYLQRMGWRMGCFEKKVGVAVFECNAQKKVTFTTYPPTTHRSFSVAVVVMREEMQLLRFFVKLTMRKFLQ